MYVKFAEPFSGFQVFAFSHKKTLKLSVQPSSICNSQMLSGFLTTITTDDEGWHQITESDELLQSAGARVHVKIDGRFVSVVRTSNSNSNESKLHCIDAVCYHMGGPLTVGDIEEVNGEVCIKCPWHHYNVTLDTGAKLYQKMDFDPTTKKLVPAGWHASERRQRVHGVERRGQSGAVWVRLTSNDKGATRHQEADTLDFVSDKWAYNAGAAGNVCKPGMNKGGDGKTVDAMRMSGDGRYVYFFVFVLCLCLCVCCVWYLLLVCVLLFF